MSERDVNSAQQCPHCAAPLHGGAQTCWTCGHEIATSEPTPLNVEPDLPDQIPLVDWKEQVKGRDEANGGPDPAPAAVPPAEASPASQKKSWSLALVGGAGVLACVTAMVVIQSLQPAASPQPVDTTRPSAPPVVAAPAVESAPAPAWVGNRQATWANDGSKTISFELQATDDVNVWMSRVRPLFVVRCLYRTTEVFVATRSAASIEGQSGNHTVRLQIDDDQELVQQWTDSVSGQELFAPNSVALVRRLASAERLRFSFTPYNAKAVTAEFSVKGFEKLAVLVGSTCGWKLDEPRTTQVRTARR